MKTLFSLWSSHIVTFTSNPSKPESYRIDLLKELHQVHRMFSYSNDDTVQTSRST